MKTFTTALVLFSIAPLSRAYAQTVTTIPGSLRIADSLQVINNINSSGNIRATGEVISSDTMRAQKDVIVEGNAQIRNDLYVGGSLNLNSAPPLSLNPCLRFLMAQHNGNKDQVLSLSPAMAAQIENEQEQNPCPEPPVIPFVWQTYGNHVSSNQRWIGTIENYDFNIKTNNTFQLICKANGDIGLGAYGGNNATSTGKLYRLFVDHSGELGAGLQDANGKYPFTVKPNGAVNIGTAFPMASPYLLTVNGRIGAREIKVSIQNPWPDYVFDKDYRLKPLEEVQEFIRMHKHLPGVPDAESLGKELCGLDLAQMQGIQMEKIEEIYLHLVELNREVQKLKQENAELKEKVSR